MENKITIGVLTLLVVIGTGSYLLMAANAPKPEQDQNISADLQNDFITRMRAETVEKVGQPIEGFEPFMFMRAFPGLIAEDFANVDALIGIYRYQNNEVVYDLNGEMELHSAARAISDEGMEDLLQNIARRLTITVTTPDDLDRLTYEISKNAAAGIEPSLFGTTVTFTGKITCLPHKGSGPHTLECAYGLLTDDGNYYSLIDLWEVAPTLTNTETRISVTGLLTEPTENEKYDIIGDLTVTSAKKI